VTAQAPVQEPNTEYPPHLKGASPEAYHEFLSRLGAVLEKWVYVTCHGCGYDWALSKLWRDLM